MLELLLWDRTARLLEKCCPKRTPPGSEVTQVGGQPWSLGEPVSLVVLTAVWALWKGSGEMPLFGIYISGMQSSQSPFVTFLHLGWRRFVKLIRLQIWTFLMGVGNWHSLLSLYAYRAVTHWTWDAPGMRNGVYDISICFPGTALSESVIQLFALWINWEYSCSFKISFKTFCWDEVCVVN